MEDIYFNPEYGKLCELIEEGTCCQYILNSDAGTIRNQYIKREAPYIIDGQKFFDIVTPYGYGGPVIEKCTDRNSLIQEYEKDFARYCAENNIICEFIRFHPIICNYKDFGAIYQTEYSRHTVGTNLEEFDDPVQSEFGKSARREVRKAEAAGVNCIINPHPEQLEDFRRLYEETMDRNNAGSMYYFPDEYYKGLTTTLRENVLEIQAVYQKETIASEIYFISNRIMHAHLLGSSYKLLEIGGGAILEATAARWGKEHGYKYIHHGGGRTSAEDDPLYLYKKKFGKHTEFDFYTGKRIWNENIYNQILSLRTAEGKPINPVYFPAYR